MHRSIPMIPPWIIKVIWYKQHNLPRLLQGKEKSWQWAQERRATQRSYYKYIHNWVQGGMNAYKKNENIKTNSCNYLAQAC